MSAFWGDGIRRKIGRVGDEILEASVSERGITFYRQGEGSASAGFLPWKVAWEKRWPGPSVTLPVVSEDPAPIRIVPADERES